MSDADIRTSNPDPDTIRIAKIVQAAMAPYEQRISELEQTVTQLRSEATDAFSQHLQFISGLNDKVDNLTQLHANLSTALHVYQATELVEVEKSADEQPAPAPRRRAQTA